MGPAPTVLTVTVPAVGEAGGTLSVTDTVKNQGGAASGSTERAFYLSENTGLDGSDVELGRRTLPALAVSASYVATESMLLPASLETGTYSRPRRGRSGERGVGVGGVEQHEGECGRQGRPDLVVSALTAPIRAVRGTSITVNETTRNQGGSEATASVTRYYLSANGALDATDVQLGSRAVGALGPGAASAVTLSLTIPAGTATGAYYIIARTDDANTVLETTENNNTRAVSLRVDP